MEHMPLACLGINSERFTEFVFAQRVLLQGPQPLHQLNSAYVWFEHFTRRSYDVEFIILSLLHIQT